MLSGILAGLCAGALWGLIFIAPLGVAPYSGVDLAIGRYLVFAAASLIVFGLVRASRMRGLGTRDLGIGIFLGMLGYGAFYGFLVVAVAHAGPQISALVIGLLPILLAVAGNIDGGKQLPWHSLFAPCLMIAAGLALVHGQALLGAETPEARGQIAIGILAALGSVASWVGFGIINARALARCPDMNSLTWTGLHGIGAGAGILLFGAAAVPFGLVNLAEMGWLWPEAKPLLIWSLVVGFFGAWVASYLWVLATKRLPLLLSGQLFVAEPGFGVIYGFLWQQRLPNWAEALGIICVFGGVLLGIAAFGRSRRPVPVTQP
jgi:drug/metabolite transporter (DMT)-like permease